MKLSATLALLAASLLPLAAQSPSDLPGDNARVNYELAYIYLLRDDSEGARPYLESAIQSGGPYADLSRIELLRIEARAGEEDAALAAVRSRTLSMEDRRLLPRAWLAGAQALAAAGRRAQAFAFASELALRFPEADEALRALLLCARLAREDERTDAAAELLLRAVRDYSQLSGADEAYLSIARLYLAPGPRLNPFRACSFLTRMLQAPQFRESALRPDATTLSVEFCGYEPRDSLEEPLSPAE
ncbi:MAG: hypothetical protein K1X75_08565 [Leptospirales bacterium]|nr:hypothetical protein [Leptospirales bacterium]